MDSFAKSIYYPTFSTLLTLCNPNSHFIIVGQWLSGFKHLRLLRIPIGGLELDIRFERMTFSLQVNGSAIWANPALVPCVRRTSCIPDWFFTNLTVEWWTNRSTVNITNMAYGEGLWDLHSLRWSFTSLDFQPSYLPHYRSGHARCCSSSLFIWEGGGMSLAWVAWDYLNNNMVAMARFHGELRKAVKSCYLLLQISFLPFKVDCL